jgi:hypothetical protein
MDLIKLLQSVEELLYQLTLWVVLIPKTFAKVVFRPRWAQSYIATEFNKEPSERFDEYISPMLFWAIVCVIPYLIAIENILKIHAPFELFQKFSSFSFEAKFLCVAVFLISGPLGVSIRLQKAKEKGPISRKSVRRIFYTQCLCFAPAYLFFLPAVIAIFTLEPKRVLEPSRFLTFIISGYGFIGWLLYAEISIITAELKIGWVRAAGRSLLYLCFSFLLMLFTEVIVFSVILIFGKSNLTVTGV